MRAAEAAKNTASLIEGTVQKVKNGSELVEKTDKELQNVTLNVERASELVGQISAASIEQAQGIEQINKAAGEMDKVVQQNAANAEESASAAEEMSAQTHQMKDFVREFENLISGVKGYAARESESLNTKKAVARAPRISTTSDKKANGHFRQGTAPTKAQLERLIPLEDRETTDF